MLFNHAVVEVSREHPRYLGLHGAESLEALSTTTDKANEVYARFMVAEVSWDPHQEVEDLR